MRIEIINTKTQQLVMAIVVMLVFASAAAAPKDFELHQAVLDNNLQLVGKFLSKGANIDLISSRKYGYGSALHLAVREGHLDIAQLLLERGAQVDVLDPDDFTPLHNAAWNGNLEMTKLLLDAGADIEASTYDGDTPLTLAQNNNQPKLAEFLQAKLQGTVTTESPAKTTTVSDTGVVDISGTYVADITGPITKLIKDRSTANQIVKIERSGDIFIGSFDDGRGKLYVEIEGDEFKFDWHAWSAGGKGSWTLKPGSKDLVGTWYKTGGTVGHSGKWNLTRIEDEAVSVASADAPALDISGRYTITDLVYPDEVTRYRRWILGMGSDLEITIEQSDDAITGSISGEVSGKFNGRIKGNKVTFDLDVVASGSSKYGNGTWFVSKDFAELKGIFNLKGGSFGVVDGKWNFRKVETTPPRSLTGTYRAKVTAEKGLIRSLLSKRTIDSESEFYKFIDRGDESELTFNMSLVQNESQISAKMLTGKLGSKTPEPFGVVYGEIDGSIIEFEWDANMYGKGTWTIETGNKDMTGTFFHTSGGSMFGSGKWDLTRLE
ncbi:MAG: ankyrin repeat domain-containing protein [Gammaproteobacteria bacterium]|nr:ankyrin repeat domain-containing protein [Gammaproteobacteria bacterium]